MSNDYYNVTTDLTPFTKARSNVIDAEMAGIEAAFDLLPSLAQTRSANTSFVAAGGTANAITVNHPITAWSTYTGKDGHKINIQITTVNTGAVTLAVDGLSAKACKRNDGTALQSGDLVAGGFYDFIYDETAGYFVVPEAINGVLEDCEEQVTLAVSQTNFIGLWSAQTGAKTVPCSVYHLGSFWALTSNIADITAKEPGVATEWVLIDNGISYAGLTGALNAPAVCVHGGYFWNLVANSSDITADVPGVSAKWEKLLSTPSVNYQEFTSSGTWVKPVGGYVAVYVEAIGGGGGGGRGATYGGGGGGGAFVSRLLRTSDLTSSVTVTIGAGGTGKTSSSGIGGNGGNTTFGAYVAAPGGKGGASATTDMNAQNSSVGGSGARPSYLASNQYPGGGDYSSGAGGFGEAIGGSSVQGGAGGGGSSSSLGVAGGSSTYGGSGGAGGGAGAGAAGSSPGGGGGGAVANNAGNGAAGRVRVWTW